MRPPPPPTRKCVNVVARCRTTRQQFGIRFEQLERDIWLAVWSFRLSEGSQGRDAGAVKAIDGRFGMSSAFRGCPGCGCEAFIQCECGGLTCRDPGKKSVKCAWCGAKGETGGDVGSLCGGGGLA